ncbi:MAG TPA: OsmC family peroxiredoxin, partial [Actinomycetes bacterium]|nr:OsmC family peroxiredoxin [Actinomycetes bacterium]
MTTAIERRPLNGVDTPTLFATLDAVKSQPDIAKFRFRASNRWVNGTHNRTSMRSFYGAGQEIEHKRVTTIDADHPEVLVGEDNGPTPAEYLLAALAA